MTSTKPLDHGEATVHVADLLRDAIIRGEFPPGERIRQEHAAALAGASRAPVREALRMLAAEGLIVLVANSGARVASLTVDECTEIYWIRERVEPLLLRMSAAHLAHVDLDHLEGLATRMAAVSEPAEFVTLDRAFHLESYHRADTLVLADTVNQLWNRTQAYRRIHADLLDEGGRQTVHDDHRLIVAALRSGDLDQAERALAGHIRRTRRQLTSHPEIFASRSERS